MFFKEEKIENFQYLLKKLLRKKLKIQKLYQFLTKSISSIIYCESKTNKYEYLKFSVSHFYINLFIHCTIFRIF